MELKDLDTLREEHEKVCRILKILGKVIIANEGINGCLSGDDENILQYANYLKSELGLEDIDIKITYADKHNFRKLWIKIKQQIIATKNWDANIINSAEYIEPETLKTMLDNKQEVYIVDARNNYEYESGHFENALFPNIKTFSKFHELTNEIAHLKDKQIVTYCTGGIRCEKASAFLKEQGFTNVKQLHGGILTYAKKCGSAHWIGKCLVFDNRNELDMNEIKNNN